MPFDFKNIRIGIIGLGYVGLPLAVEFGKKIPTIGFDVVIPLVARSHDALLRLARPLPVRTSAKV